MNLRPLFLALYLLSLPFALRLCGASSATNYPPPVTGDFTIRDFHFQSGEVLPEMRIHYRTLGQPRRDTHGLVRNAVLILHGTTGSGGQFIRPESAGELFCKGQPLDAEKSGL